MGDAVVVITQPESRRKHVGRGDWLLCSVVYSGFLAGVCPEMPALRNWSRGRSQRCRDNVRCGELNSWSRRTEKRKSERAIEGKKRLVPGDDEMTKQCASQERPWKEVGPIIGGACAQALASHHTQYTSAPPRASKITPTFLSHSLFY
jgi:hypothetical protein